MLICSRRIRKINNQKKKWFFSEACVQAFLWGVFLFIAWTLSGLLHLCYLIALFSPWVKFGMQRINLLSQSVIAGPMDSQWYFLGSKAICECVSSRSVFESIYSLRLPRNLILGSQLQQCLELLRPLKNFSQMIQKCYQCHMKVWMPSGHCFPLPLLCSLSFLPCDNIKTNWHLQLLESWHSH